MQPPSQVNNNWSLGNSVNTGSAAYSVSPAPPELQQTVQYHAPAQIGGSTNCVLRHVGADPYLTKQAPLSADEHRWAALCQLKSLPPSTAPPEWMTRAVASIPAATVDQVGPPASAAPSGSSTSAAATAPAVLATSPSGDTIRHPDPATSIEEIRWRDYQSVRQHGGVPSGTASSAVGATQVQQAALPAPSAAAVLPLPVCAPTSSSVPQTPLFPTPVRTLFPPTPVGGVAAPLDEFSMDTSDVADPEARIQSIYVRPEYSIASPEEMRVVQVESYKTGRQVAPYWLVK